MSKSKLALALAASLGLAFGGVAIAAPQHASRMQMHGMSMPMGGMNMSMAMDGMSMPMGAVGEPMGGMNWFGGPIYHGAPALKATAALVRAGGGARNFSFAQAMVSMLGQKTVNAEVAKLDKQYGKTAVNHFIDGMNFAVEDGLKRATAAGVTLPAAPAGLKGVKLAKTLIGAGTVPNGTFWAGYLFDHALSHKIHDQVMADIDAKWNHAADRNTHKILNQAMYDVAHKLGKDNVKLASLH